MALPFTLPRARQQTFTDARANILPVAANEWLEAGRRQGLRGEKLALFVRERLEGTAQAVDEMVKQRGLQKELEY